MQERKTGRNQKLRQGQRESVKWVKGGEAESLPKKPTTTRPLLVVFHCCSPMLPGHPMQIQYSLLLTLFLSRSKNVSDVGSMQNGLSRFSLHVPPKNPAFLP